MLSDLPPRDKSIAKPGKPEARKKNSSQKYNFKKNINDLKAFFDKKTGKK